MANIFAMEHTQIDKQKHEFEIFLTHDTTERIVLATFKDMISVKIKHGSKGHFGDSMGLMGTFEDGLMLARDGATIIAEPTSFGDEWQVKNEENLFQTSRFPQYPEACVAPGDAASVKKLRRRLGEKLVSKEEAEKACAHLNDFQKTLCVFDVLATNDLEVATGAYSD